jgi:hypothetical protein
MLKHSLGKFAKNTKTGPSVATIGSAGVPQRALTTMNLPQVSASSIGQTGYENPLGTRFTIFALAFNAFGLATLTLGGISIGGNALAADAVLGSSLVCLSAYLIRSIIGKRGKKL